MPGSYIPTALVDENASSVRANTVRARTHPDNHIRRSFIENLVPSFVRRDIEYLNTVSCDNLRATTGAGFTGKKMLKNSTRGSQSREIPCHLPTAKNAVPQMHRDAPQGF